MFDSLEDRIKHDDQEEVTTKERMMHWAAIAVVSVLVFGGLVIGIRILD